MNKKDEEKDYKKYNYIGYNEVFPLEQNKYIMQEELLLKLARESVRKQDYYHAIRYLNMILMKNPNHALAKRYKRHIVEELDKLKQNKDYGLISLH